jgi:RNA polymerase sigma factor (sigma-70 family)
LLGCVAVEPASDAELLERWRNNEPGAGEALFKRHFDSVYGFFETKCAGHADELTQSTFLACVQARDKFRGESSFRTYLFAIARNELHHLLRTRFRKDSKLDFEVSSMAEIVTTPATRLARNQEHRQLVESLQTLPVDQQMLLELHYRQDMQIPELADVFSVSVGVIRQRMHRARKALREQLERLAKAEAAEYATREDWAGRLTRDES